MRRVLTWVAAASMLVLVACSGSDVAASDGTGAAGRSTTTAADGGGDDPGPRTDDPTDDVPTVEPGTMQTPAAWAAAFCGSFDDFVAAVEEAIAGGGTGVLPDDYVAQQQALVEFFDLAADEAAAVATGLEDGGVPEVDRGDELVAGLVDRFESLSTSIQETSEAIAALDPDPATFEREASAFLTSFQEDISAAGSSLTEIDEEYPSDELTDALASACAF